MDPYDITFSFELFPPRSPEAAIRMPETVEQLAADLPDGARVPIPSRIVHMPLSWDDPATREAIDVYMRVVRDDAPWCPSNLEFIRRVNGLDDIAVTLRGADAIDAFEASGGADRGPVTPNP